jgi:hypothetical protein
MANGNILEGTSINKNRTINENQSKSCNQIKSGYPSFLNKNQPSPSEKRAEKQFIFIYNVKASLYL